MTRSSYVATVAAVVLLTTVLSGCLDDGNSTDVTLIETTPTGTPMPTRSTGSTSPSPDEQTGAPDDEKVRNRPPKVVGEVATGLEVPWGVAFLPDGDAVVTERDSGRVLLLRGPDHEVVEVGDVAQAAPAGEGGLLGVAVSPDFADDATLYLYVTTAEDNRVVRGTLADDQLGDLEPVLTGIPTGFIHDGGRMVFGPDGYLYVSTGEGGEPERAPDPDSLGGKILRITTDGDPAPGNPDPDSPVWSLGHRNVQGLAFVGEDLWASEFGNDEADELNRIVAGGDYGWPAVEGTGGKAQGYVDPQVTWPTDEASPSGLAWAAGHLWLAALKGQRLWRVDVDGRTASNPKPFLVGDLGRLRTVVRTPDGHLWVTTSNRDGRGTPVDGDDRIVELRP